MLIMLFIELGIQTQKFAGNVACMMADSEEEEVILYQMSFFFFLSLIAGLFSHKAVGFSPLVVSATFLDLP